MSTTERKDHRVIARARSLTAGDRFAPLPRAGIALGMSLLLWLYVGSISDPSAGDRQISQISLPLQLRNSQENLVAMSSVSNVTVRVRENGRLGDTISREVAAYVDLAGRGAGAALVPVEIDGVNDSQLVSVAPAQVSVDLEPVKSRIMPVTARVVPSSRGGVLGGVPRAEPGSVTLAGAARVLQRVTQVRASVSESDLRPGLARAVLLQPVDAAGRPVQGVVLTPSQVQVTVPVGPTVLPDSP